jgi:hypothetical protein
MRHVPECACAWMLGCVQHLKQCEGVVASTRADDGSGGVAGDGGGKGGSSANGRSSPKKKTRAVSSKPLSNAFTSASKRKEEADAKALEFVWTADEIRAIEARWLADTEEAEAKASCAATGSGRTDITHRVIEARAHGVAHGVALMHTERDRGRSAPRTHKQGRMLPSSSLLSSVHVALSSLLEQTEPPHCSHICHHALAGRCRLTLSDTWGSQCVGWQVARASCAASSSRGIRMELVLTGSTFAGSSVAPRCVCVCVCVCSRARV